MNDLALDRMYRTISTFLIHFFTFYRSIFLSVSYIKIGVASINCCYFLMFLLLCSATIIICSYQMTHETSHKASEGTKLGK